MWLIARRSFTDGWPRLLATLLAALFSVALIAGTVQFAARAQSAVSGSGASEYSRTDVLVQGGAVDTGDPQAIPDGGVPIDRVAARPGVAAVAGDAVVPVIAAGRDGRAIAPPAGTRTLLRPWVADPGLAPYRTESGRAPAAGGEVAVTRHLAEAGRLDVGGTVTVGLPRHTRTMKIVGVVSVQGRGAVTSGDLLIATPETVHRDAGLPEGTWQSVWVKARPGVPAARLRGELERSLGAGATVREAGEVRDAQAAGLTGQGAEIGGGIGMLTGVATFVGLFVVANTFGGLVRQRTRRLALLGAIGATPAQIKALIRLEALALGLPASLGGALLGHTVADVLIRLFAEDGFDVSAADPAPLWIAVAAPVAAGVLVTQLAVWRAARRAAAIVPMRALRESAHEQPLRRRRRLVSALLIFLSAFLFYGPVPAVLNDDPPGPERTNAVAALIAYGSMVTVVALAVLGPLLVRPFGALVGSLGALLNGEAGRLARATITRSPQRVSAAASSLMLGVALAATAAIIMISANARFDEASAQVMRAEHAVSTTDRTPDGLRPLPRDLAERLAPVPGVTRASALTTTDVRLVSPAPRPRTSDQRPGPLHLAVTGADQRTLPEVLELGGGLPALAPGEIGLPSSVMEAQRLEPGGRIVVHGRHGEVPLTVAGAYHDPSHLFADEGLVAPATMNRLDRNAPARLVLVRGGTTEAIERAVAGVPGAAVLDRIGYARLASATFAEGTTVIYGFIAMTLLLALFGTATTVSMSVTERRREFGLLGAVGTTGRQIRSIVRWEAATVVVLGTGLGLGVAVGTVGLIHVATGSSFIRPNAPWWVYALITAGAAVVALATSALPARRASSVPVLEAAKAD